MAKVIMVQGTMSSAGKSLIVAALCRIFKEDGYRVAPFKSQNMALNSYVTEDGLEMGRAQVMQAQAAGIKPHVHMNPVLLKPTSDVGSQVIVNGKVRGTMKAKDYFTYKQELIPEILSAFNALQSRYDIIVIEGAGSPAEINLKQQDIVNMGLAKLVDAPVLLVGDIDRGGVFAQLIGTTILLEEQERQRIKGFIMNKFRGDKSILDPGIQMLEEKTKIPVLSVMPYLDVHIEDEDSLSQCFERKDRKGVLEIAVIRYPRISNFTDFLMLEQQEAVNLYYVNRVEDLGEPDLIFLPGTKNTMGDMKWLRESGMEGAIKKQKEKGKLIFGICGGFQMLGHWIEDPRQVEEGGIQRGMGLLPITTCLTEEKVLSQVTGQFYVKQGSYRGLHNCNIQGYEIHMGISRALEGWRDNPFTQICRHGRKDREPLREGAVDGDVAGTYVHGIFDEKETVQALLQLLAERKGISLGEQKTMSLQEYREQEFEKLAKAFRENSNMEQIYQMISDTEMGVETE